MSETNERNETSSNDESEYLVVLTSPSGTTLVEDTRFRNWKPPRNNKSQVSKKQQTSRPKTEGAAKEDRTDSGLSEKQIRFLKTCFFNKNKASTKITKLAGIALSTAQKYRKHLVQLGYLKEKRVTTGSGNQESIFLEVTASGIELIKSNRKK